MRLRDGADLRHQGRFEATFVGRGRGVVVGDGVEGEAAAGPDRDLMHQDTGFVEVQDGTFGAKPFVDVPQQDLIEEVFGECLGVVEASF